MSGIGGWLDGPDTSSADRLLARLGDELSGSGFSAHAWHSRHSGLAVAGPPQAAALYASGVHSIAIFGHPRWIADNRAETDLGQVCRKFLEGYRARGAAALEALQGDFALVVIDSEAGEALLAIDRFGIRNLVYQADQGGLIFGSSCDVVRRHPGADQEVDPQAIYDYTYFHAVPGPKTVFRRQERLLPGHFMMWSRGGKCSVRSYWAMTFPEEAGSVSDFKPRFRQVLRDAVTRAVDGAECGAFLSGGTDSSTVAGLLGSVAGAPAKTYSIGFAVPGYDEMEYARIASRHFGTEHHEYYVTADDVVEALPAIAAAYDQPFGNASAVAAFYCARLAKSDGVTRMLAGDGGDELFGGNTRYAKQYLLSLYEKLPTPVRTGFVEPLLLSARWPTAIPLLRKTQSYVAQASRPMPARYDSYNLIDRLGPQIVFTPDFLSRVDLGAPLRLMDDIYAKYCSASLINQMLGIDLKFTLADSDLPKVTRMCELAGVEVAFPLLDEAVVELSGRLPAHLKLRGTGLRYFFKESLRDFLPREILRKKKHGFGLPAGAWLTTHPGLSALAGDCLSSLKGRGIVAPAFIDRLLAEHVRVHAAYFGTMVWVLMMMELWFQKHSSAPS
jgi:asparagine synthase (glutamine-hydrolysing)